VGRSKKKKSRRPDREPDRAPVNSINYIFISRRRYDVWLILTRDYMNQTQVAEKLKIRRQTVNEHAKALELLGLLEPINPNGSPKFYKSTEITPIMSGRFGVIISKNAKKMERTVRKRPILVRDRRTGRIKHWKSHKKVGYVRNYDTIISVAGRRIPILRVHSISYTCTILHGPEKSIPWSHITDIKGGEQYIFRHTFKHKDSEIFCMKELDVTFVRQITSHGYDELIIYMPEKYLFEFELEAGKKILQDYVKRARKWFQNKFKTYLGEPIKYREMEIARELFEPKLKKYIKEHQQMVKIKTDRGHAAIDSSKKGYSEIEYTTIEEVKADLNAPDRILALEEKVENLQIKIDKITDIQEKLYVSQEKLTATVENFIKSKNERKDMTFPQMSEDSHIDVV